jgi:hypothetical protein
VGKACPRSLTSLTLLLVTSVIPLAQPPLDEHGIAGSAVRNSAPGRMLARFRWATNPLTIVDLAVTLTFWADVMLEVYSTENLKGVGSTLRIFRLLQLAVTIFKLEAISPGFRSIAKVLSNKTSELAM